MKSVYLVAFALLISSAFFLSCNKDQTQAVIPVDPNCIDTVSFAVMEPIIIQTCATSGCHDANSAGGINLVGHSNIALNATDVLTALRHETVTLMPIGGPQVHDSIIQDFSCWIGQGKMDN